MMREIKNAGRSYICKSDVMHLAQIFRLSFFGILIHTFSVLWRIVLRNADDVGLIAIIFLAGLFVFKEKYCLTFFLLLLKGWWILRWSSNAEAGEEGEDRAWWQRRKQWLVPCQSDSEGRRTARKWGCGIPLLQVLETMLVNCASIYAFARLWRT